MALKCTSNYKAKRPRLIPGVHDGVIAYVKDGHLIFSIEAKKNSNYRYSPVSSPDVFSGLGELAEIPDVICTVG